MRHPQYVEPLEWTCGIEMEFPPGIGCTLCICDWYQPWKPLLQVRVGFWVFQVGWIPRAF